MFTRYAFILCLILTPLLSVTGQKENSITQLKTDISFVINRYIEARPLNGDALTQFEAIKFSVQNRFQQLVPQEQNNIRDWFSTQQAAAQDKDKEIMGLIAARWTFLHPDKHRFPYNCRRIS